MEEEEEDDDEVLGTRKRAEKGIEECFGAYSSFCSLFSWHVVEVGSWKLEEEEEEEFVICQESVCLLLFFLCF